MLTFEQIKELIGLVAQHRLQCIEMERSGFRLKIDGQQAAAAAPVYPHSELAAASASPPASAAAMTMPAAAAAPAAPAAAAAPAGPPAGSHVLTSPIVGTYYSASSPDAEPFVEVGARVKKGQVLCIIEAMKLMNEIESDADGTVERIYPQNGQPIEYGEKLFAIKV